MCSGIEYLFHSTNLRSLDPSREPATGRRDRPNGRRGADAVTRVTAGRNLTFAECQVGFPIRRSTDQSLFSAPHGLSQSTTSFIASCRQGIHQTPLLRLIRSRRRRTLRATPHRAPLCKGAIPGRPLAAWILSSRRAPSAERAPGFGQCHVDLGKTIFAVRHARRRRRALPSRGRTADLRRSLPFLSLHDVKARGVRRTRQKGQTNMRCMRCRWWRLPGSNR